MEELSKKAESYRLNSVAASTKRTRGKQWECYLNACGQLGWSPMPCDVNQACLYVTMLAERLKPSSVHAYYQSVIFHHVCAGLEPVRVSNPILNATLKGIERCKGQATRAKDPLFPKDLQKLCKCVDFSLDLEFLVFVAALFLFRTLLRVSHVVESPHTLKVKDLQFKGSN